MRLLLLALVAVVHGHTDFFTIGVASGTDKVTGHAYHNMYNALLHSKRLLPMKVLEIGLGCTMNSGSASIMLWQKYFANVDLWMADIDTKCADEVQHTLPNPILIGDQSSPIDMQRWLNISGGAFDLIVDDGSHNSGHQLASFDFLFRQGLKPGGLYVIEDIESIDTPMNQLDTSSSRYKIMQWMHEFLKFPRSANVDLPHYLMMITCQREACAFHKCPLAEERCP